MGTTNTQFIGLFLRFGSRYIFLSTKYSFLELFNVARRNVLFFKRLSFFPSKEEERQREHCKEKLRSCFFLGVAYSN